MSPNHGLIVPGVLCKDGVSLADAKTELLDVFAICVSYLRRKLPNDRVTVTSVLRPHNTSSTHAYGRAIDFRVERTRMHSAEVIDAFLTLKAWMNMMFQYLGGDGKPRDTFVYRSRPTGSGDDPEHIMHVHLQIPVNGWRVT